MPNAVSGAANLFALEALEALLGPRPIVLLLLNSLGYRAQNGTQVGNKEMPFTTTCELHVCYYKDSELHLLCNSDFYDAKEKRATPRPPVYITQGKSTPF